MEMFLITVSWAVHVKCFLALTLTSACCDTDDCSSNIYSFLFCFCCQQCCSHKPVLIEIMFYELYILCSLKHRNRPQDCCFLILSTASLLYMYMYLYAVTILLHMQIKWAEIKCVLTALIWGDFMGRDPFSLFLCTNSIFNVTLKNQQISTLLERGSFIFLSFFNADGCVYTNKMKLRLHEGSDQK